MNLSWLEDFLALAASGNFSRAAEARFMTQPAFSRRIKALEEWLGVELVDRAVQPFALTEAGYWFVAVARDQLARVARMPADAQAIANARAATLHFAATHALSLTFVPSWFRSLEGRMPQSFVSAPIELMSDVLQRCEDSMLEQRVDFLLCHAHAQVPGRLDRRFPSATIGHDALLPVAAPGPEDRRGSRAQHRMTAGSTEEVPILAFSAESGLGRIVSTLRGDAIEKAGGRVVFTAHLATVLRSMAIDGRGVAWLPRSLIEDDLRARRLVAAAPMSWRVALDIRIFRSDGNQTPAAQAFWSAITSNGEPG